MPKFETEVVDSINPLMVDYTYEPEELMTGCPAQVNIYSVKFRGSEVYNLLTKQEKEEIEQEIHEFHEAIKV